MNNTKNILLVAIITAALVLGTSVIPMQSYADRNNDDDHKNTKDFKSSIRQGMNQTKRAQASTQARTTMLTGGRRRQPGKPGTADNGKGQRGYGVSTTKAKTSSSSSRP